MDINSVKVELSTKLRELCTKTVGNIESQCWVDQPENLLNDYLYLRCIPIKKLMPTELLCNVFSFTKREDLFSCQLVNRHWNLVIEINLEILPLKYFLSISSCLIPMLPPILRQNDFINLPILQIEKNSMSDTLSIGTLEHEDECMIAKSFVKYGVFEFCEVNGNSWYEIPTETIALLERIQNLTGRKIRARGLYGPVDERSLMALKKYIDFEEVTETLDYSSLSSQ